MINFLLSEGNTGSGAGSWWIYVVLIVLVVVMLVIPTFTNRRRMKDYNQMVDRLRVGDEVRTIGGIIGRVVKINKKGEIATFVLETGAKGSKTTMEFDMNAIGTVLKSTYVEPATNEKDAKDSKEEKAEKVEEKAAEEKAETEVEAAPETEAEAKAEVVEAEPKAEETTDYGDIEKQISGKKSKSKKK